MMRLYTDAIILLMLIACGEVTSYPADSTNCQPYHETYSHSVIYCGEEQDVFITCNPRVRREEQVENCVNNSDLLKSSEECYSKNICMDIPAWENEGEE